LFGEIERELCELNIEMVEWLKKKFSKNLINQTIKQFSQLNNQYLSESKIPYYQ
jgi:hypothetical protein